MYNIYFDSGTSNTRIYLIENDQIRDKSKANIGSKDSSITGNNDILIKGLKDLYSKILEKNNLKDNDIKNIYASGMITSPFGIKEIPHLSTPVSLKKLFNNLSTYYEPDYFQRNIKLVRGVKTISDDFKINEKNINSINNMRGEEIEIFGILSLLNSSWVNSNLCIFMPGSHTHIAYMKNRVMEDILSTFSGELFHALKESTILSSSIDFKVPTDKEMIKLGFENLQEYGINRALYLANTMQIFSDFSNSKKTSYLEGVINGGVVLAFKKILNNKWKQAEKVVIAGNNNIAEIYNLLVKHSNLELQVKNISSPDQGSFALEGLKQLLKLE